MPTRRTRRGLRPGRLSRSDVSSHATASCSSGAVFRSTCRSTRSACRTSRSGSHASARSRTSGYNGVRRFDDTATPDRRREERPSQSGPDRSRQRRSSSARSDPCGSGADRVLRRRSGRSATRSNTACEPCSTRRTSPSAGECAGVVADRTGLSVGRSASCGRVRDVERGDEVAKRRLITGQLDDALGDGLFRTDGAGQ